MELELTEDELKLVKKLVEANDSGASRGYTRLGGLRIRTSLQHKVFTAVDALGGVAEDSEDEEAPDA
jgi:hypothetical protein